MTFDRRAAPALDLDIAGGIAAIDQRKLRAWRLERSIFAVGKYQETVIPWIKRGICAGATS